MNTPLPRHKLKIARTYRLPEELLAEAERYAHARRDKMQEVIEFGLRAYIEACARESQLTLFNVDN